MISLVYRNKGSNMNTKSQYNTKQHEEILDYLKSIQGRHVTAGDVYRHMLEQVEAEAAEAEAAEAEGTKTEADQSAKCFRKIGQATVYRQLDRLVEEGFVDKYIIDQNSPACYEYIGTEHCGEGLCVHGKCLKCGRIFHLHCDEIKTLEEHLEEHHGFTPDFRHTVIYGVCDECRN